MWKQIPILLAAVFLANAYRIPRAIEQPATDFIDIGNGIDPIINLRKLSVYLLQRLPSVETNKIIISLAKDSYDRSMNEQIQGFHDVMSLLMKGAWAQVIRRNEKESKEVKNHVFEAFLLQQVSAVEADKIMNALDRIAYGTTEEEKIEGFTSILNLLVDGVIAKIELKKRSLVVNNNLVETDLIGELRKYLLRRIPSTEADRIVNFFAKYLQAKTLDEKREANRQLMNILVDGALAQIALDGVSPTKIMNTATTNKNTGLAFTSDIERIQKVLVERMPLDEADRILNVFLKIITGETSDVRDQGEWELFDMLVEGARAKETLQNTPEAAPIKILPVATSASLVPTTTDYPTYIITFNEM